MERIAVIDFETTGITPSAGCRATEVAVVTAGSSPTTIPTSDGSGILLAFGAARQPRFHQTMRFP